MRKSTILLALLSFLFLGAHTLSWVWDPPFETLVEDSDLIVVGELVDTQPSGQRAIDGLPGLVVEFTLGTIEVQETLKGDLPRGPLFLEFESEQNTSASRLYHRGQSGVWLLKQRCDSKCYEAKLRSSLMPLERRQEILELLD